MNRKYGKGWAKLVTVLVNDLRVIAPDIKLMEISEGRLGRLQAYYSDRNLTAQQMAAADRRVQRAEAVAWETCVECGEFGNPAYIYEPPLEARMRVFCEAHKPLDWNYV